MSETATNRFVVPKRRVEVDVQYVDGARHRAAVFLAAQVPQHDGPERLSDLFESNAFVPAIALPGDCPVWLHRDGLAWIRAPRELEPDPEGAHTLPTEHDVELTLSGGLVLRGLVSYVRPDAHARLTDFLNESGRFLPLLQDGEVVLVHKRHVLRVALSEG